MLSRQYVWVDGCDEVWVGTGPGAWVMTTPADMLVCGVCGDGLAKMSRPSRDRWICIEYQHDACAASVHLGIWRSCPFASQPCPPSLASI
eukprot:353706-Chlamydomonas_euryale.AAC.4